MQCNHSRACFEDKWRKYTCRKILERTKYL